MAPFPIREVSFSNSEVSGCSNGTSPLTSADACTDLENMEPLPLSHCTLNMDFAADLCQLSIVSDDFEDLLFESAIDELLVIPFPEGDAHEEVFGC